MEGDGDDKYIDGIVRFITQSPSKELTIEFKGNIPGHLRIMREIAEKFRQEIAFKITFRAEIDARTLKQEVIDTLADLSFGITYVMEDPYLPESLLESVKDIQRRTLLRICFETSSDLVGRE